MYNLGEGIKGLTVSVGVLGQEDRVEVKTDILGNYQVEISQGFLDIAVQDDSGKMLHSDMLLWLENESLVMDLRVEPGEDVVVAEGRTENASALTVPPLSITW